MDNSPAYYRARLAAFDQVIREESGSDRDENSNHSVVLRNGVIPNGLDKRIDNLIQDQMPKASNDKLSFEEMTRFNTWFEMFPGKVAGTEFITTSREFPIMIKGTQEDIIRTVTPLNKPDNRVKRISMAKARALARKRSLELLKIN